MDVSIFKLNDLIIKTIIIISFIFIISLIYSLYSDISTQDIFFYLTLSMSLVGCNINLYLILSKILLNTSKQKILKIIVSIILESNKLFFYLINFHLFILYNCSILILYTTYILTYRYEVLQINKNNIRKTNLSSLSAIILLLIEIIITGYIIINYDIQSYKDWIIISIINTSLYYLFNYYILDKIYELINKK